MVMMSQAQAHKIDPAVEEVLASIRQIMAIDLDEESDKKRHDVISLPLEKKTTSRKRSAESSDILTLTEMITTDGSVVSLSKRETQMAAKPDTEQEKAVAEENVATDSSANDSAKPLDLNDSEYADETLVAEDTEAIIVSTEDIESLMSPEAVAQSTAAFGDLNKLTSDMKQNIQAGTFGDQTVEQLMREMLRPLLKEWLDSHLPSLVKWLVAEKIEQMIREKHDGSRKTS